MDIFKNILSLVVLVLFLFPSKILAEIRFSDRIQEYYLDNNMKVILIEDKRSPVIVSSLWYKVGSSYEYSGVTGISHILEHMMFKGTKNTRNGEFSAVIKNLGGNDNAFTGRDFTGYYQKVHKDFLETCLKYESDRMTNLILEEKDLMTEREVVKEERRLRTDDQPTSIAFEKISSQLLGMQKYGIPIIGTMDDINSISIDDLKNWYNKYYSPSNAILIIAGDFNTEKTKELISKYFGPIPDRKVKNREVQTKHIKSYQAISLIDNVANPLLIMSFENQPYNKSNAKDFYALQVLFELMDGGYSSRFTKNLTDKKITLNTFIYFDNFSKERNLISIGATPRSNISIKELQQAILMEFQNLIKKDNLSISEMNGIKSRVVASNIYKFDSVFYQAMQIGMLETKNLDWRLLDNYVANIMNVTYDDLKRVSKKYILENKFLVSTIMPK